MSPTSPLTPSFKYFLRRLITAVPFSRIDALRSDNMKFYWRCTARSG